MRRILEQCADAIWYGGSRWWVALWPFAVLYRVVVAIRWRLYLHGWIPTYQASIPVVVVGNITVGGSGKSPLVLCLAGLLMARGIRPGILLRGYGRANPTTEPVLVGVDSEVDDVGDEALMIFQRLHVPVCVCARRSVGSRVLEERNVDVILCDDGLQHYALHREMEIALVDGKRGFGNGKMLPAGPLRESPGRLARAHLVITHVEDHVLPRRSMRLRHDQLYSLTDDHRMTLESFSGMVVDAVAGIGNPVRFFATLRGAGLIVVEHRFPDHHNYARNELQFDGKHPLLMTEKDAVKCRGLRLENAWFLRVDAVISTDVENDFFAALNLKPQAKKTF